MEGEEFGEFGEVAGVCGNDGDAEAASAGGDEGVIGEAALADLLIVVLGGQPGKGLASARPVAEIGNDDAPGFCKVAFEALDGAAAACIGPGIKFFQNYSTQPEWSSLRDSPETQGCGIGRAQGCDVKRSVEQCRGRIGRGVRQLTIQRGVEVLDGNAAGEETLRSGDR